MNNTPNDFRRLLTEDDLIEAKVRHVATILDKLLDAMFPLNPPPRSEGVDDAEETD